ncbi:MAG: DUF2812 domain-containing protein [Eubacteriales bacterium]
MKHIVYKAFANYEKEEKWLNEMSAKGMALTAYSWCRYVFEETPNNEYTYRIELLEDLPVRAANKAYIKFLEENGVECVATYMRWIYLRRKSSEGEFDIYSDLDSKIKHYKRVYTFWFTMMWVEFLVGSVNVFLGILNLTISDISGNFPFVNVFLGLFVIALGLLFLGLLRPIGKKIKTLKKEKEVRE